jgi:hypothetical protein
MLSLVFGVGFRRESVMLRCRGWRHRSRIQPAGRFCACPCLGWDRRWDLEEFSGWLHLVVCVGCEGVGGL